MLWWDTTHVELVWNVSEETAQAHVIMLSIAVCSITNELQCLLQDFDTSCEMKSAVLMMTLITAQSKHATNHGIAHVIGVNNLLVCLTLSKLLRISSAIRSRVWCRCIRYYIDPPTIYGDIYACSRITEESMECIIEFAPPSHFSLGL